MFLNPQHKIILSPATELFKAWEWHVDFMLEDSETFKRTYLECKGKWIIGHETDLLFSRMLQIVEARYPSIFDRLYLISGNKGDAWTLPCSRVQVIPIDRLYELLQTS